MLIYNMFQKYQGGPAAFMSECPDSFTINGMALPIYKSKQTHTRAPRHRHAIIPDNLPAPLPLPDDRMLLPLFADRRSATLA